MARAVAAIPQPRRRTGIPDWAGVFGFVLGGFAGAAACYVIASLL
jgi:hypothetical protein